MTSTNFAYTTRQVADLLSVQESLIYSSVKRKGSYCGMTPTKSERGRWMWPRAESLKLKGSHEVSRKQTIDLRAWFSVVEGYGYPRDDLIYNLGIDLLRPTLTENDVPQSLAWERLVFLRQITSAIGTQLMQAWELLDGEDKARASHLTSEIAKDIGGVANALV